ADAEAVIRSFGGFADFDRVFVDDVFVGLGVALFVVNVPAERFEKGVEEFATKLGLVVMMGFVGIAVAIKALDQFEDEGRRLAHVSRGSLCVEGGRLKGKSLVETFTYLLDVFPT